MTVITKVLLFVCDPERSGWSCIPVDPTPTFSWRPYSQLCFCHRVSRLLYWVDLYLILFFFSVKSPACLVLVEVSPPCIYQSLSCSSVFTFPRILRNLPPFLTLPHRWLVLEPPPHPVLVLMHSGLSWMSRMSWDSPSRGKVKRGTSRENKIRSELGSLLHP